VVLPDEEFEKNRDSMNPTDVRKALLRQGFNPAKEVLSRSWNTDISSEQQLTIQSFGNYYALRDISNNLLSRWYC
jgi:hypothetical protein